MARMETYGGERIERTIGKAIEMASSINDLVEFDFNGVTVQVAPDSNPDLIFRDWQRGMLRPSGTFTVSPYPPQELSSEQIAEDERLSSERDERARVRQAEYDQRQRNAAALLEGALMVAPPLALKDEEAWQKAIDVNTDSYGGAVIRFAGDWGRLMQMKIEQGDTLSDIADECCSVADAEGITGFMYGCAVSILSQVWIHGEELRRWHNLKTQVRDEGERANENGGVLNPALIVLE